MIENDKKLGAFIVPTGIGASIGGYAGDASAYARKFAKVARLIVNPNVVNAGGFSGITPNMFYVEGYTLDSFFKGEVGLVPAEKNRIGVVFDCAIPQDVLNIHINTLNAVKTVYDLDIVGYEMTQREVGVKFTIEDSDISVGSVACPETMLEAAQTLLRRGANAIALVCMFDEPQEDNPDYANGIGTDPVGGVEAILSHYVSRELRVPCAHSPAFEDYNIYPQLVNPKSASEYITPTFLPCILLGLSQAPQISANEGIFTDKLDFLVMPYNSVGSTPFFETVKRGIDIYLIKENVTALDVTPENLGITANYKLFETYDECLKFISM